MSYNRRYGNRRASSGAGSRWMNLRYAGSCKVCGATIPAGELAYWDSGAKTVTHRKLDCAAEDGLTTYRPLTGPWDTRADTREFTDTRVGAPAARVTVSRFNSGAVVYRNARGRCEDAPCCGCCS